MAKNDLDINDFRLNRSAVFYELKNGRNFFSISEIRNLIKFIADKDSYSICFREEKRNRVVEGENLIYSIVIFRYKTVPTFIEKCVDLVETRYGYLLIVEYKGYVVLSKKGVSVSNEFNSMLEKVDYSVLQGCFLKDETVFKRFTMHNIDGSVSSIRSKIIEAENLQRTLSSVGLNKYILSNLRFSNSDMSFSLGLNTSRINNSDFKVSIVDYLKWCKKCVDSLERYTYNASYLDVFAESVDYTRYSAELVPQSILFDLGGLISEIDIGEIVDVYYRYKGKTKSIKLERYWDINQHFFEIKENHIETNNAIESRLNIKSNQKKPIVCGKKVANIYIKRADSSEVRLLSYINQNGCFSIYYTHESDCSLWVYRYGKLFKDSHLLNAVDGFLNMFIPCEELSKTLSEKGMVQNESVEFDQNCVFGFVEKQFRSKFDFFICDDLGDEWADHIGISTSDSIVSFFIEKSKRGRINDSISATAFQDVISQAQKNLGNLTPTSVQIIKKINKWKTTYNFEEKRTKIARMRKGDFSELEKCWKNILQNPLMNLEMNIVVDFISFQSLKKCFDDIKSGGANRYKNQAIQILWLISSLDNAAKEVGARLKIFCKP